MLEKLRLASGRKWAGILSGLLLLGIGGYFLYHSDISPMEPGPSTEQSSAEKAGSEEMEPDAPLIDLEKKEAEQDFTELFKKMSHPQKNTAPRTLAVHGHSYYLVGDILMPLDESWSEYDIPAADDRKYDSIHAFYLAEESPENWTQRFFIHKVNPEFQESAQEFMERLISGALVTLSDRMALEGNTLSKDDVSFNYVRKDENNSILYWGLPGNSETQFVRVFRSGITNDLYVVTADYRMDISDVTTDFAGNRRAELESIQQLKPKKG